MYSEGDLIVYGVTGVCAVENISEKASVENSETKVFYTLRPLYQRCVITVPAESTKVFMRPVISRDEANSLIDSIPDIHAEAFHDRSVRQLTEHYEQQIKSHSCTGLLKLAMSIYEKRRLVLGMNKKLGAVDERYMRRAEELLFGELAAALSIERDKVREYIRNRIGIAVWE